MRAQDLSIYRKAVRTKGRKTAPPPEPVLGDSVMSGRLLISGRHLILTLPLVRKMKRNTGENEKNGILGCLVKTRNRVKKPFEGETTDIGERVHSPKKEQEDERERKRKKKKKGKNYFKRLTRGLSTTSPESRLTNPSP